MLLNYFCRRRTFSTTIRLLTDVKVKSIKNPTLKTKYSSNKTPSDKCVAYCISDSIRKECLPDLFSTNSNELYKIMEMGQNDVPNVYRINFYPKNQNHTASSDSPNQPNLDSSNSTEPAYLDDKQLFVFLDLGVIVSWNRNSVFKIDPIIAKLKSQGHLLHDSKFIEEESELVPFQQSGATTNLVDGKFIVKETNNDLDKLAFSHSLALSVKLSYYEHCLQKLIDNIRHLPASIRVGNTTRFKRIDMLKIAGEIENLKLHVNLDSNFLNVDDMYWDYDDVSKNFQKSCQYLNIFNRTNVFNMKLNSCSDITSILRTHLNEDLSHRLEWIIIALISVEVVLGLIKFTN